MFNLCKYYHVYLHIALLKKEKRLIDLTIIISSKDSLSKEYHIWQI